MRYVLGSDILVSDHLSRVEGIRPVRGLACSATGGLAWSGCRLLAGSWCWRVCPVPGGRQAAYGGI
jgi:hypothetical protein